MVLDALRVRWGDPSAARIGRRGQRQNGVDIHGRDARSGHALGAQAKNRETLGEPDIVGEISKAEGFRPALNRYYFVLSGPRDEKLQASIRALSLSREAHAQFAIEVMFFEDVCGELAGSPELVKKHWPGWSVPGSLRVVDVDVDDTRPPTTLDVKVRNTGAFVCFVKWAEIDVVGVGALYQWYRPSLQHVTAEYDVDFDPREPTPYVIRVPTSQVIEPQGTDRLVLRIRFAPGFDWFVDKVIVNATIRLVFNEDDEETVALPLLFAVRPPWRLKAMRFEPPAVSGPKVAVNRRIFAAMLGLTGKASPTIEKLRVEVAATAARQSMDAPLPSPEGDPPHLRIRFGTPDERPPARQSIFRRTRP